MLILILGLNHLQVNYPYLKTPYVNTLLSVGIVILLEIFYLKTTHVNPLSNKTFIIKINYFH